IGVALLALAIIYLLAGGLGAIKLIKTTPVYALAVIAALVSGLVLGALFGMPQIAKWIPGDSPAEQKAMEISQKAAQFQARFGLVALAAAVVSLLYMSGLIKLGAAVGLTD